MKERKPKGIICKWGCAVVMALVITGCATFKQARPEGQEERKPKYEQRCYSEHLFVEIKSVDKSRLELKFEGIGVQGLVGKVPIMKNEDSEGEDGEFDGPVKVDAKILSGIGSEKNVRLKPLKVWNLENGKELGIKLNDDWSIKVERCEHDVAEGFTQKALRFNGDQICCGDLIFYDVACKQGDKKSCDVLDNE